MRLLRRLSLIIIIVIIIGRNKSLHARKPRFSSYENNTRQTGGRTDGRTRLLMYMIVAHPECIENDTSAIFAMVWRDIFDLSPIEKCGFLHGVQHVSNNTF